MTEAPLSHRQEHDLATGNVTPLVSNAPVQNSIDLSRRRFLSFASGVVAGLLLPRGLKAAEGVAEKGQIKMLYEQAEGARESAFALLKGISQEERVDGINGMILDQLKAAIKGYESVKQLNPNYQQDFPYLSPNIAQVYLAQGNLLSKQAIAMGVEQKERSLKDPGRIPADGELMALQKMQIDAAKAYVQSWDNFPNNVKNWEAQYRYARLCAYTPILSRSRINWKYADEMFYYAGLALQDPAAKVAGNEDRRKLLQECEMGRIAIARNRDRYEKVAFEHRNLKFDNASATVFCNGKNELCVHRHPSEDHRDSGVYDFPVFVLGDISKFGNKQFSQIALELGHQIYDSRVGKIQVSSL